jgi:hypothetical protein
VPDVPQVCQARSHYRTRPLLPDQSLELGWPRRRLVGASDGASVLHPHHAEDTVCACEAPASQATGGQGACGGSLARSGLPASQSQGGADTAPGCAVMCVATPGLNRISVVPPGCNVAHMTQHPGAMSCVWQHPGSNAYQWCHPGATLHKVVHPGASTLCGLTRVQAHAAGCTATQSWAALHTR